MQDLEYPGERTSNLDVDVRVIMITTKCCQFLTQYSKIIGLAGWKVYRGNNTDDKVSMNENHAE